MNIGVSFPQTEIGRDPAAIKDFIQTAEDLGFSHITFVDHVLGSSVAKGPLPTDNVLGNLLLSNCASTPGR